MNYQRLDRDLTVGLSLLLGTPAAYAIARFDFKGKKDIWFWFIDQIGLRAKALGRGSRISVNLM
jgi:hypothetical protein